MCYVVFCKNLSVTKVYLSPKTAYQLENVSCSTEQQESRELFLVSVISEATFDCNLASWPLITKVTCYPLVIALIKILQWFCFSGKFFYESTHCLLMHFFSTGVMDRISRRTLMCKMQFSQAQHAGGERARSLDGSSDVCSMAISGTVAVSGTMCNSQWVCRNDIYVWLCDSNFFINTSCCYCIFTAVWWLRGCGVYTKPSWTIHEYYEMYL